MAGTFAGLWRHGRQHRLHLRALRLSRRHRPLAPAHAGLVFLIWASAPGPRAPMPEGGGEPVDLAPLSTLPRSIALREDQCIVVGDVRGTGVASAVDECEWVRLYGLYLGDWWCSLLLIQPLLMLIDERMLGHLGWLLDGKDEIETRFRVHFDYSTIATG
ncbi:hypothetical protein DFH07DRAFT_766293 [Mycena maculata]|uniref:Uncharacterized protein n=1 Tax=Mycena maculata TaxID=230809 RepID=A0AAD7K3T5_9AGAR|nr:hypothetical protein DFH07DRAFT_766293 [Mycena maculata]